jgi:hypothetical protein
MSEQHSIRAIDKVLSRDMSYVERIEKTYGVDGFLDRHIMEIGGDTAPLGEVRAALTHLFSALEGVEEGALRHLDNTYEQADPVLESVKRLAGLK